MGDAGLIKVALIIVCVAVCFCLTETRSYTQNTTCGRYDLKNGVATYRIPNRIVKYSCNRGYVLVGSRLSRCTRGQWDRPIPVCASSTGCDPLLPPPQGFLSYGYGDAVTYYKCHPGYLLIGSSTVYCDGRNWNGSSAACVPAVQSPSLSCDFEQSSLCYWSQDTQDDFDWRRNQQSTPSAMGTGPSYDHTHGKGKSGYYMYIEASAPRRTNDTARLYSPVFQPDIAYSCFTFWYHMLGSTIGSLRVYIKKDNEDFRKIRPLWLRDGDQGNEWLKGTIPFPKLHRNFQVIIEGVRGTNYFGDIAIDDVSLQYESCEASVNSTDSGVSASTVPVSNVTAEFTTKQLPVVTKSTTLSTSMWPITDKSNSSIDLFSSTRVSLPVSPITSESVADVTMPSQFRSSDEQTSSLASTNTEWPDGGNSTSTSATKYSERTKRPKNTAAQVSNAPSSSVLAGTIVAAVFLLIAGVAVFIYFKKYRLNKKQSDDSDMRYLTGSDEIEYVDSYHSSEYLDQQT